MNTIEYLAAAIWAAGNPQPGTALNRASHGNRDSFDTIKDVVQRIKACAVWLENYAARRCAAEWLTTRGFALDPFAVVPFRVPEVDRAALSAPVIRSREYPNTKESQHARNG